MPSDRDRRRTPPGGIPGTDDSDTVRLARAARDTSEQTLDRVGQLRSEVGRKFEVIDERLNELSGHVGDLRETSAGVCGKLEILVDELREDRAERKLLLASTVQGTVTVSTAAGLSEVKVRETAQLAVVDEGKSRREHRRKVVTQFIAIATTIAAAVATAIAAGRC